MIIQKQSESVFKIVAEGKIFHVLRFEEGFAEINEAFDIAMKKIMEIERNKPKKIDK